MKQFMKRGMAMMIALVLVISLVPGSLFTASAASYTYNWGARGVLATELSDTAEAWYAKYNASYEELSALNGSSSASSVPSSALYSELKTLMTTAHTTKTSYDAVKNLCQYTDCQNGGGKISSFYSGTPIGPAWDSSEWNREHTWPNSKGLGGQDENDIMMLRPTSIKENSSRGNTAYGEGSSYYDPNSESGGKYNLHGDVARIVLYVYVRWGNTGYMWGTSGVMESKDVLLKWMEEDPVDTWELGRNDAVQSITGTRNVFVDYPELAFDLFEEEVPADYESPSGSGAASAYTITAQSGNLNYGTVSQSGNTITAYPYDGYVVSGYQVVSGTANVTQNGNTFTVKAQSNCTVQINFVPRTVVTVSFAGAGGISSQQCYAGDAMTLPTASAPEGYTFLGWMTTQLGQDTAEKPEYYSGSFIPAVSTTLYALYSYMDENSGTGTGNGDYVKVTSEPADWSGEYVIVYEAESLILDGSLSTLDTSKNYQSVTITDNTISAEQADGYKFTIAVYGDGYSIQSASGKYISGASGSNKLSSNTTQQTNTISLLSDGSADIVSNTSHLRYNSGAGIFRYYRSSSYTGQKPVALYQKNGSAGTAYYTGTPIKCEHANTSEIAAVAAACTQSGFTAGVFCNDCETYISGHEVVAPLGHNWGSWTDTTAPTCTDAGVQTRACTVCGAKETQTVAATGHSMDAGVVTTPATCTDDGVMTYTCYACGAAETETITATGHSYVQNGMTYTCSGCGDSYEVTPVTALQYVFDDYTAGTQYAQGEVHKLDEVVTLTINGAYLTEQLRLYSGSNAVFASDKVIDSIVVNAGDNSSTLNVYGSVDGESWTLIKAQSVTSSYKNYTFDMPEDTQYTYLKLESNGKQIRVPEMTINVLEPVPPQVDAWNITLEDDLKVKFVLDIPKDYLDNTVIHVTVAGETTQYQANQITDADGQYSVEVEMAAAQMTEAIEIRFVADSEQVGEYSYTIRQYADTILADETQSEYHALVKEMLNYGAMAQKHFSYNTDNLANAGITDAGAKDVPSVADQELSVTGVDDGIGFHAASLVYRDKVALRFYFKVTGTIDSYSFTANGTACERAKKDDYYYIEVADITPENMDKQIEVVVTGTDGNSLTVRYSPMNYMVRMSAKGDDALKALLKSLYNYHLAAKALGTV